MMLVKDIDLNNVLIPTPSQPALSLVAPAVARSPGTHGAALPSSLYRSAAPLAAVHSRASGSTPTCRKRFGWSSLKATRRSASRSRQLPQPRQLHTPHWCTHSLDVSTAERTHRPALARSPHTRTVPLHTNKIARPVSVPILTLNARILTTAARTLGSKRV